MKRLTDWLVYCVVRVLICVIQALPLETCQRLSNGLAIVCNDWIKFRRDVVDDNLRHALPDLTAQERLDTSRRMWAHLILMICEIAHAPRKIHETNWRDHISLLGARRMVGALIDRRPLVAVTAHYGNFEVSGYIAGLLGFPTFTMARPLDNPYLHDFLLSFRATTGQFILPNKGSSSDAQQVVDSGETLAILGDHFGGRKGCYVEFFNRPASCHKSIALFSLANKSPLVVTYARRKGNKPLQFEFGTVAYCDPADPEFALGDVPLLTRWYNEHLEKAVREHPDQYWWLHRRWKDPRKQKRKRKKSAAANAETPNQLKPQQAA